MTYHSGEVALQSAAGVRLMAERIGRGIRNFLPPAAVEFLHENPFVVAGGTGACEQVWASALPGTFSPIDNQHIVAHDALIASDPLFDTLTDGARIGTIFIDFATRRRMRINGTVQNRDGANFEIEIDQAYSNCAKHIRPRDYRLASQPTRLAAHSAAALTPDQQQWIAAADTFFIATSHPEGGADASHRGGPAGFVRVVDGGTLQIPDYSGNMMFNTLGNIFSNPAAGLLFLDFDTGSTLQLSGHAALNTDPALLANFDRAERMIEFRVETVLQRDRHTT